jgi:hypothetical protein
MYRVKYFLTCAKTLLIFLPFLAAGFLFGAFYPVYNMILLFLILSITHNLLNKKIMIQNMVITDIIAATASAVLVYFCGMLNIPLYSGAAMRGLLILICLNQLFMYSRNNYKERVSVRKRFY